MFDTGKNCGQGGGNGKMEINGALRRGMLSNLAAIGIGLGIYEQKWWPALAIGAVTGLAALFIAWRLSGD